MVAGPWRPGVLVATPVGQRSWGLVWCQLGWVGLVRGLRMLRWGRGYLGLGRFAAVPLGGGTEPRLLSDSFARSRGLVPGDGQL